jgi:hypothetical protein
MEWTHYLVQGGIIFVCALGGNWLGSWVMRRRLMEQIVASFRRAEEESMIRTRETLDGLLDEYLAEREAIDEAFADTDGQGSAKTGDGPEEVGKDR